VAGHENRTCYSIVGHDFFHIKGSTYWTNRWNWRFIVSFQLLVVASRSNRSIENQKVEFINMQQSESQEVCRLNNEIEEIQKQINDLG
jgi:hypothetical protein